MQVSLNLDATHPHITKTKQFSTEKLASSTQQVQANSFVPTIITFGGQTKKQIIVYAPESQNVIQKGGVGTVATDFAIGKVFDNKKYQTLLFMPYYNGEVVNKFDETHSVFHPDKPPVGKYLETRVRYKDGKPIFTKVNMVGRTVNDLKPKEFEWLQEVAKKEINTASGTETARLFKIINNSNHPNTYLIFTQGTAAMRVPYGDGISYSSGATPLKNADPYAVNNFALTEMLPELESKGIKPTAIVLNDPQTAYTAEYMARKAKEGSEFYQKLKTGYILHNPGDGYQQNMSHKAMFSNLATPEQIKMVEDSEVFKALHARGLEEELFKRLNSALIDEKGETSGLWLALKHREAGTLGYMGTVSPGAAKSYALGEGEANGIKDLLKKLYMEGKFVGVLNGMDSPSINPMKVSNAEYYATEKTVELANGKIVTLHPLETFDPNGSLDEIINIKQRNAANFLERINLSQNNPEIAIGSQRKETRILGKINKKLIDMLKKGSKSQDDFVKVFVSWGRGDEQKGLDVTINAFRKYMHDSKRAGGEVWRKAQNSVLVLGGEVKTSHLKEYMYGVINAALDDPLLKGRFAFMDGYAPNAILSNAGNLAVFPSRFAPCELTDHEARSYGCHTLVTGLEGLDDKNFDIFEGLDEALEKGEKEFRKSEDFNKLMKKAKKSIKAKLKNKKISNEKLEEEAFKQIFEPERIKIINRIKEANKTKFTGFKTVSNALTDVLNLDIAKHPVFSKFSEDGKKKIKEAIDEYKYARNEFITKWTDEYSNEIFKTDHGDVRLTLDQVKKKVAEKLKKEFRSKGELYVLEQRAKDAVVSQELAEKMREFAMLSRDDLKQGMSNNFKMEIQWRKNCSLQRFNKLGKEIQTKYSAGKLYERLIAEKHVSEKKTIFNFSTELFHQIEDEMKELLKKIKVEIGSTAAGVSPADTANIIENAGNPNGMISTGKQTGKYLNKETAVAALGFAAFAGLLYYLFKPEKTAEKKQNEPANTYIA